MAKGQILVIGSQDASGKTGVETDRRVLEAHAYSALIVVTAFKNQNAEQVLEVTGTPAASLRKQINDFIESTGVEVVKIGALFAAESVSIIFDAFQSNKEAMIVVDTEAIFKTGLPTPPELLQAVREKLLPLTTVLSATVPEAKMLLDDAGVETEYPKNMQDVQDLAKSLTSLGPKYVIIKREIFEEEHLKTTLNFVLCGKDEQPLMVGSRFDNPKAITGVSYSLPSAIAANLADGQDATQAVRAAFKFVEAAIKDGVFVF